MQVRKLTVDDLAQARALGTEAFGGPATGQAPPPLPTELPAGRHAWGAFDGDRLVAKVQAHEYESWWRGARVPTCGVAGVAVAAEHRGAGLLQPLLEAMLAEARERGERISTLFPTANGIYRSFGYELVTSYDRVTIPTAELARVPAPSDVTTRRADVGDVAMVRSVYDEWAAAQNGPLTRTGPLFGTTDAELLEEESVTVAVDTTGRVVGALLWEREGGYGPQGELVVHDLVALSADAYRALWRVAGSFASVTGLVRLSTSGDDPARLVLPTATWDVASRHPYSLRVLDVVEAFSGLPPLAGGGTAEVRFAVRGDRLAVLDGVYALHVSADGSACARETGEPDADLPTFTTQGLALAWAGAQSCGNLRLLGHLSGPTTHDAVLDALLGAGQIHVRDYF